MLRQSIDSNISVLDAHLMLGLAAVYQDDCHQAGTHFAWFAQHFPSPVANFGLALGAVCGGQRDRARQLLAQAEGGKGSGFVSPYQSAMVRAYLGEKDAALEELGKSADAREGQIFYISYDPAFDGIRNDSRFIGIEKRIGLK